MHDPANDNTLERAPDEPSEPPARSRDLLAALGVAMLLADGEPADD